MRIHLLTHTDRMRGSIIKPIARDTGWRPYFLAMSRYSWRERERERERGRGQISMQEAGSKIYAEKYVCLHCSKKETVSH